MKTGFLSGSALLCALLLSFASCDNAGNGNNDPNDTTNVADNQTDAGTKSGLTMREERFVINTLEANAEEMAWLRAAADQGTDAEMKTQAQQMMADHEKMDTDMRAYATKKNLDLADVDVDAKVNLMDAKGAEWDEEWADEVGDMHRRLINRFERAENYAQDAELKDMVTKTLPTLRAHHDMLLGTEKRLDEKDNK